MVTNSDSRDAHKKAAEISKAWRYKLWPTAIACITRVVAAGGVGANVSLK